MKKFVLISMFAILLSFLTACDPSANLSPNTSQVITSGSWRVTLFMDSGNDETSEFSGYSFVFETNGTLAAIKNGITQNGTWTIRESSNKLIIDLGPKDNTNKPLGELTDDWKIISKSNTEINLTDDNASSQEFLTFTRN
jgi:hypothetical protein